MPLHPYLSLGCVLLCRTQPAQLSAAALCLLHTKPLYSSFTWISI